MAVNAGAPAVNIVGYRLVPPDQLLANPANPRRHPNAQREALRASLRSLGWIAPVVQNVRTGHLIDGHARIEEALSAGVAEVPVIDVDLSPEQEALALATFDPITAMAALDRDALDSLLRDVSTDETALQALLADVAQSAGLDYAADGTLLPESEPTVPVERASLADRFLVPPFSVLDARQGYWQTRKRAWLALGIQSELGRGDNVLDGGHSDQSINIDFYAKKRALEAELGRDLTTDEARNILVDRGEIRHVDRSKAGKDAGLLGFSEQARSHYRNAAPGGWSRDATTLKDGHTQRGDGAGRAFAPAMHAPVHGDPSGFQAAYRQPGDLAAEYQGKDRTKAIGTQDWVHSVKGEEYSGLGSGQSGTSIFDPVLCELAYRWWCPPDGHILDPFAGGSVRGIVASLLGRRYTGIDLSARQLEANRVQAATITPEMPPTWVVGDSGEVATLAPGTYDLVFSCPPYADLERYSDDPRDLSTLAYADFLVAYQAIIAASVALLAPDRFACFVVGDVRDTKGFYRNFVSDTIAAFQAAGATLYNEAILVTAVGSLPIRVGKQFEASRKLGKTHQQVLVFCKGDPKRATVACGPVDVADFAEEFGEVV